MFIVKVSFTFCLVAALTSALESPCPEIFRYDSTDQPGQWSGTLTFLSDSELYGVWARIIFDDKITSLTVGEDFEIVSTDNKQFLLKNPNYLLKAKTPVNVKITVKYNGDKIPSLAQARLNARVVCPERNPGSGNYFSGDLGNQDFLTSIISKLKPSVNQEITGCGTNPLYQEPIKNQKLREGQWPWQASIYVKNQQREEYICGATLISSQHVLTAAHCVTWQNSNQALTTKSLNIHLGNDKEKFEVEKIILYPGYSSDSLLNDLAIVQLNKKVQITDYIRPVCLGNPEDHEIGGVVVGYGIGRDGKFGELAQTKIGRINNNECVKTKPNFKQLIVDNGYCGQFVEDGGSICVGDSGSGLVSLRGGSKPVWELRGVVTLGIALQDNYQCNSSNFLYLADVAKYIKWIQKIISY